MIRHWQMEFPSEEEIRYIHSKPERKRRMLKRSTSIVDDGNDETCVRHTHTWV
jgi:hypothetical protein